MSKILPIFIILLLSILFSNHIMEVQSFKSVYCKNLCRTFETNEIAREFEIKNKYIIDNKLEETQIFI